MIAYIVRRTLYAFPILIGVNVLTFVSGSQSVLGSPNNATIDIPDFAFGWANIEFAYRNVNGNFVDYLFALFDDDIPSRPTILNGLGGNPQNLTPNIPPT